LKLDLKLSLQSRRSMSC